MKKHLAALAIALGVTVAGSGAFARTATHAVKQTDTSIDMVAMCDSMMRAMMADPALHKRMNALMQKHMSSMMGGNMRDMKMHSDTMNSNADARPAPTTTP